METGKKAGPTAQNGSLDRVTGAKTKSSSWGKLTLTRGQDLHVEISCRYVLIWKNVSCHLRQFYFHFESKDELSG